MSPLPLLAVLLAADPGSLAADGPLIYPAAERADVEGAGAGGNVVFLAGDHEYRSEETLPALARILAKRHGFRCTVLFTRDPQTGAIDPAADHLPGLEALEEADLLVVFLRFKNLPDAQMEQIDRYLRRGGPVVGLRTATHAFKIPKEAAYRSYGYDADGSETDGEWEKGFGRAILGETWAGHHGKNHVMSTRFDLNPDAADHPVLRGVKDVWVESGGYWTEPVEGSKPLAFARPLQGMTPDSPIVERFEPCPAAWVRTYDRLPGRTPTEQGNRRVFATTGGASVDLRNDGFRRLLVNACLWAAGREDRIDPQANVDLVGPYRPRRFQFDGWATGVQPTDLAGWEAPIPPPRPPSSR